MADSGGNSVKAWIITVIQASFRLLAFVNLRCSLSGN